MPDPGLTDADREKLADMARNGIDRYARHGGGQRGEPNGVPVTCHRCGHKWRYTGDRARATCSQCRAHVTVSTTDNRGFTAGMCNAIREAARDGLTYRQIAESFGFVNSAAAAYRHATGDCQHGGEGVERSRPPGGIEQVPADVCAEWRDRHAAGESQYAIAKASGRHKKTVWRHVRGECSHD